MDYPTLDDQMWTHFIHTSRELIYELQAFPKLVVFNQDDYFYDEDYEGHLRDSKGLINWDCSNAFDMKRLRGDIVDSKIANDLTCVEGNELWLGIFKWNGLPGFNF